MFAAIARRVAGILIRPDAEWVRVAEEAGTARSIALGYAAVLLTLPPAILIVLGLVGIGFTNASAATVFTVGLAGLIGTVALVILLALIVRWVAGAFDVAIDHGRAFSFTIHATTPLWIGAAIGNLIDPLQRLLAVVAFVWTVVLIAKGATAMLGIARQKRGVFTYTVALSQLVLWLLVLSAVLGVALAAVGGDVAAQLSGPR